MKAKRHTGWYICYLCHKEGDSNAWIVDYLEGRFVICDECYRKGKWKETYVYDTKKHKLEK